MYVYIYTYVYTYKYIYIYVYGSVPSVLHKLEGHMRHGVVFCCGNMEGTLIICHV